MLRALALALLLAAPLSGCLSSGPFDDLWEDLDVEERFETREVVNETQTFSPAGLADPSILPPESPEDVRDPYEATFELPAGTRSLQMVFFVNFTTPESPVPGVPQGEVTVFLQGPEGEERQNVTLQATAGGSFDVRRPNPGTWTYGFRALGNGEVGFHATAVVPTATQEASGSFVHP